MEAGGSEEIKKSKSNMFHFNEIFQLRFNPFRGALYSAIQFSFFRSVPARISCCTRPCNCCTHNVTLAGLPQAFPGHRNVIQVDIQCAFDSLSFLRLPKWTAVGSATYMARRNSLNAGWETRGCFSQPDKLWAFTGGLT